MLMNYTFKYNNYCLEVCSVRNSNIDSWLSDWKLCKEVEFLLVGRERLCWVCWFSPNFAVISKWCHVPGSKFSVLHSKCDKCSRSWWQSLESLCLSLTEIVYWHFTSSLSSMICIESVVEIVFTTLMLHSHVSATMVFWEKRKRKKVGNTFTGLIK